MYVCPRTGGPLKEWYSANAGITYPLIEGVPLLVSDPVHFLSRAPVRAAIAADARRAGLPDALTPHLPPSVFGAPGGFGQWLTSLAETSAVATAAGMAQRHAPPGAALDAGCGVGVMARRMVAAGRDTWAFDLSADAVLLARGLLTGALGTATIPTSRRGLRRVKVPLAALPEPVHFCIADPTRPPYAPGCFAWIHLGDVLDTLGEDSGLALVACEQLLAPGGLLTVTTAYDTPGDPVEAALPPEEELLEALEAMGLAVVDQQDRIPMVIREYDRSYRIKFMHCVAARCT